MPAIVVTSAAQTRAVDDKKVNAIGLADVREGVIGIGLEVQRIAGSAASSTSAPITAFNVPVWTIDVFLHAASMGAEFAGHSARRQACSRPSRCHVPAAPARGSVG